MSVQSTGRRKQQKSTCGAFFQKSFFREREQASPHTHLHCSQSSEGTCHCISSHRATCKRHLPSSLSRPGASQCRPVLPRATAPEEKIIILQQGCTRWPGDLPCTAPGHSTPQGQPQQGLAVAVLLHLPRECHTPHPPEQPRAGPQSLLSPGGLQGHPAEAAQQHHRHIITLNHKITGGSRGLATQSGPL